MGKNKEATVGHKVEVGMFGTHCKMDKEVETTLRCRFFLGVMENLKEKATNNEMKAAFFSGVEL